MTSLCVDVFDCPVVGFPIERLLFFINAHPPLPLQHLLKLMVLPSYLGSAKNDRLSSPALLWLRIVSLVCGDHRTDVRAHKTKRSAVGGASVEPPQGVRNKNLIKRNELDREGTSIINFFF